MRPFLALPLLVVCATCASPDPQAGRLDRVLTHYAAGESQACIPADRGQTLVIENRSTIIARRGGTIWVNRLAHECPGFEAPATVIVERNKRQFCRGDRVRGLPAGARVTGPFCALGVFTPYRAPAEPTV